MKKILFLAVWLCGISVAYADNLNNVYDNAHLYTQGNGSTSEALNAIEIDWINGDVSIVYGDVQQPTWEERPAGKQQEEHTQMYYRIHEGELSIQFCESGRWRVKRVPDKTLILTLPRDAMFTDIDIENVNGKILVAVKAAEVDVETVNGEVEVHNLFPARKIGVESVNGALTLVQPEDKAFVVEYETVLGRFSSDIQGTYSGSKRDGIFRAGDTPLTKVEMETVNGSMHVRKAAK